MGCRLKNMVFIGGELTAKGVSLRLDILGADRLLDVISC